MGRLLLLTIAFLGSGGFGSHALAENHPDFSGHWILNLDQSRFGKLQKPDGMTLVATVSGNTMHAVQTANMLGGPVTTESDWVADGKEHIALGANGGKMITRWEGDILYSERQSTDGTYEEKVWLSLSKDGKTATEKVLSKGPDGTNVRTLVWQRP